MRRISNQVVVIPLDGSADAERVLPYVEPLAHALAWTIMLLHVTKPPERILAPSIVAGSDGLAAVSLLDAISEAAQAERYEAIAYLDGLARELRDRGLSVLWEQYEGDTAKVIVERATAHRADLIAMLSRGSGALHRLILGSVVEEVQRNARCPVMLVRISDSRLAQVPFPHEMSFCGPERHVPATVAS